MRGFESLPRLHTYDRADDVRSARQPDPSSTGFSMFVLAGVCDPLWPLDPVFAAWQALQRQAQHCVECVHGDGGP